MGNIAKAKPNKDKISRQQKHDAISFAVSSMKGWRPFMEDAHLAIYPFANNADIGLFGVFDGHLGPEIALYAQKYFPSILANNQNLKKGNYEIALTESFIQLDQLMQTPNGHEELIQIRKHHASNNNALVYEGKSAAGCTANVVLVTKDHVYCANAGDSRAVAAIKNDKQKLQEKSLSYDHKPHIPTEMVRIKKAGGYVNMQGRMNDNLNVSRGFGDFTYKMNPNLAVHEQLIIPVPDITKTQRSLIDFIILGCDGIWERKKPKKMVKWIKKQKQQETGNSVKVLQKLFDNELGTIMCYDELGMDNMTAILIDFHHH